MTGDRRRFVKLAAVTGAGLLVGRGTSLMAATATIDTPTLRIGYEDHGDPQGFPIVLLHGFPDDVRAWDEVVPPIVAAGYRVLVPYLRGFGPTRFLDARAPRVAQQAAIGQDVVDFADALRLPRFALAGYDWGGRAAAIAAVRHPDRVRATVLIGGYTIQNTIAPQRPGSPEAEYRAWYQWYFQTERGRAGLAANRRALCRLLWTLWSPNWSFTDAAFERSAASFDNPDFVDVVIHSYRHRHGQAEGEARFAAVEAELATRPLVQAPSITLYGAADGVAPPAAELSSEERAAFVSLVARRVIPRVGHFMPRERPDVVVAALLELLSTRRA